MTLTQHDDITYRVHYTTKYGTDFEGVKHNTVTSACQYGVHVLHHHPCVSTAEVHVYQNGKHSHLLCRLRRYEDWVKECVA